ncbi:hypothetical protein RQP46_001523 [Phenoliferia psychrophenolica]
MLPPLPLELTHEILKQATHDLVEQERHDSTLSGRANYLLLSASLVSHAWRSIAQSLLLRHGIVDLTRADLFIAELERVGLKDTLSAVRIGVGLPASSTTQVSDDEARASGVGLRAILEAAPKVDTLQFVGRRLRILEFESMPNRVFHPVSFTTIDDPEESTSTSTSYDSPDPPHGRASLIELNRMVNSAHNVSLINKWEEGALVSAFLMSRATFNSARTFRLEFKDAIHLGACFKVLRSLDLSHFGNLHRLETHLVLLQFMAGLSTPILSALKILRDPAGLQQVHGPSPETKIVELISVLAALKELEVPDCWRSDAVEEASLLSFTVVLNECNAASANQAKVPRSSHIACADLKDIAATLYPSLEVYAAESYPANSTFSTPTATAGYNTPVPNLAAFCRFGADFNTSSTSKVQMELWLPIHSEWNGRYMMVGNGGDLGGINYPDMGIPLSKYHFAVSSTNTGHNGTVGDGTFAINGPETQIDFGYRAVHKTAVFSKGLIEAYYSTPSKFNYWSGCSSGGKQGLKEVQQYPDEFDGVIAGQAAQYWNQLLGQIYRVNAILNPINSTGHLSPADYARIGKLVMSQCDGLDGLEDGIILNPRKCHPDLSTLSCADASSNKSSCMISQKIETMYSIYANWTSSQSGKQLFTSYEPGSEDTVLNKTTVGQYSGNETELESLIKIADATNPGGVNAVEGDISEFLRRGKLITFVGLADPLIPSGSSIQYRIIILLCGGTAAFNFGGSSQSSSSINGTGQSSTFDAKHDMILALMAWTEHGVAPDVIIGSNYVDGDIRKGIKFQRKLCPYPAEGVYTGGDPNSADSFECQFGEAEGLSLNITAVL